MKLGGANLHVHLLGSGGILGRRTGMRVDGGRGCWAGRRGAYGAEYHAARVEDGGANNDGVRDRRGPNLIADAVK